MKPLVDWVRWSVEVIVLKGLAPHLGMGICLGCPRLPCHDGDDPPCQGCERLYRVERTPAVKAVSAPPEERKRS